ncbi:Hypothetical protein LUCI_3727 [Lucifera butyrica]|uniref:HTH cro/C1-type domain-containing protein n=1 Tax=Lucifera butyrica TaxID=1351585 RepID=A0A498RBU8_9FIRM|nr:helix-turn-helix transcriptional regulator [Lucifera butyrica]VBB08455.1 Hypothetical protein LUCI_3727 [Lucifera butyrica]
MNIGLKIKDLRTKQGMSMTKLAKEANVGQATISHIENNDNQPTFDILERIITALGFSLAEFFADEQQTIDPELNRLLQATGKLTSEQRNLLFKFINSL